MATTDRGFSLSHQKVVAELDLNGRLRGRTELTLVPTRPDLRTVYLHSRDCNVLAVSHLPDGRQLDFSYLAPPPVTVGDPKSLRLFPEAKRRSFERTNAADEGELAIAIDPDRVKKVVRPSADGPTPAAEPSSARADEYEAVVVSIEYEIREGGSGEGISVVQPTDSAPDRVPHLFTNNSSPTAARSWVPCVDSLHERCTWELDLVVPRALVKSVAVESDPVPRRHEFPLVVVASGELLEQVSHPHTSRKSVWRYLQPVATSVQHIAWAVGPFERLDLARQDDGDDPAADERASSTSGQTAGLYAFCLPGKMPELKHSAPCARRAFDFFADTYGSYPFSSYKLVFVDALASPTCAGSIFNAATVTLFPQDLLHPPDVIDQAYETRPAIAQSLAAQWTGINIIPKAWSDVWLVVGLQLYTTSLFLRQLWGNNEYRFRLRKDVERCVAADYRMAPLCQPGQPGPPDSEAVSFINLKAPLVLYILDKHLRKAGTSLGLSRVIPKLFLSAISGELKENTLSTSAFLRMCRRVAGGGDLRGWADQWIYSSGCPHFTVSAYFNRKRMMVELTVRQESRAKTYYETQAGEGERCCLKPNPVFEGQMTIRIHEADGTPYEHIIEIRDAVKRHDLPFNTKYKRVRRNTKRFQARQAAAAAAAQGDVEATEDLDMMDLSFAYPAWEDQGERERWKVADWTEEDDQVMSQATYEWLRFDAEFEWLATSTFDQPDYMWLEQLQRDRDVVAQLEAIQAVSKMPSAIVSSQLCKTVLVSSYFFRVRIEAALALASCAKEQLGWIGMFHLLKLFQTGYCYEPRIETLDPFLVRCIPRGSDFTDFAEYFIRKAILAALASIRTPERRTPPTLHQFFVDQLAYNDNTTNPFSDSDYLATLVSAAAHAFVDTDLPEQSEFFGTSDDPLRHSPVLAKTVEEVEHMARLDELVPSHHQAISIAAIGFKLKLTLAGLVPVDLVFFLRFTREGNAPSVRVAAFDALLLLKGIQDKAVVRYMFIVLRDDVCLVVRRRLAQSLVQCLPILVTMGDLGKEDEGQAGFEEDLDEMARKKDREAFDHKAVMRSLRHEVGRANILRECISAVMLAPNMDEDVQSCLIKMCEILLKPQPEKVPKVRLRMPTNTTAFASDLPTPSLPKVKLTLGTMPAPDAQVLPPKESPRIVLKQKQPFNLVENAGTKKKQRFEASGMDMTDYKACRALLKKLVGMPVSQPFRVAVDPIRDGAPDYFNIVKDPMDLGTMGEKLESGQYADRHAFHADFELVIGNCRAYNRQDSPMVLKYADPFKRSFDKQWTRSEKTIESLRAKAAKPARPPRAVVEQPAPPTSSTVSRPGGLKLTLKSRPSDSSQAAAAPSTAKSSGLRIKFGGASVTSPEVLVDSPAVSAIYPPVDSYFPPIPPGAELVVDRDPARKKKKSVKLDAASRKNGSPALPLRIQPPSEDPDADADADGSFDGDAEYPLAAAPPVLVPLGPPPAGDVEKLDLDPGTDEPLNSKKAKTVLRKTAESEAGIWFRLPVDPVALGLPTYFDEIDEPMDLGTMQRKLEASKYKRESQLFYDFNLVVRNAVQFNGIHSDVGMAALRLDAFWKEQWAAAKKIGYGERRGLQGLLNRLSKVAGAEIFAKPVDPVELGIPTYFQVIGGPENARDLGTIKTKLDSDRYETVDEFEDDVRQMFRNCFTFNPPEQIVYTIGKEIERNFDQGMAKVRKEAGLPTSAAVAKRRAEGSGQGGAAKKVKVG